VLQKNSGTDYDATWATPSAYVSGDEVLISPGTPGAPNFELWVDTDDDTGNTVGSGAYTYKLPGDTMTNATPGTAYSEGITFMDIQSTTSGWPTAAVPCELWCYKSSGQVWQDLLAPNKPSSGVAIRYSRVWDPVAVAWGPWYQDVMSTQSATIITARQDPPRGYMAQNLAQAIPTGAWTLLTNMVARYQKGTPQVTMGTNRLILPIDGLYRITGGVYFASAITLRRGFWFRKNGATTLQQFLWMSNNTVANAGSVSGSADEEFSAGDYLEGLAYQESGANVNTNLGNYFTWLSATWIAPL